QVAIARTLSAFEKSLADISTCLGSADAGYKFQNWFYDLVEFHELPLRRPYNADGRQIDGSVTIGGTTYLVELKFTRDQVDVTAIDSFFKKVITKADNTMGILVSMSGFSSVAVKEASRDRTPL